MARRAIERARPGGEQLLRSAALDSSPESHRRGALLLTPGPAPPSAGFASLKAPANAGRIQFPARPPPIAPSPAADTPPQVAAGDPQRQSGEGARRCGGRPPLRAKRETEAPGL